MTSRILRVVTAGAVACAFIAPLSATAARAAETDYTEQVLAVGVGGTSNQTAPWGQELGAFYNYRIPAVVQLNDGDILVSYDGRPTGEDAPGPNSIVQRRSTDGGKTWGPETYIHAGHVDDPTVSDDAKSGYSDPAYVYDKQTGTLFNFHVYSKDAGFVAGGYGDDDSDRNVLSAEVSVSTDDGETWEHRLITSSFKTDDLRAAFASSGHGIQIVHGKYAGRLVLQFAGAFSDATQKAFSLYSDDHGATWKRGGTVGTNMDENKVVELSDGTLMLNSRIHSGTKARYVATSTDGGESWSELTVDSTLVDPVNNASIIRKNADADPDSREAKELLFSNAASTTSRTNGTVRYSCDDGKTWPVERVFASGGMSYSDLVALDDGTYGLFYEGENGELRYASFTEDWLNPFCANISPVTLDVTSGVTATAEVTIRNDDDRSLPAGDVTATVADGWTVSTAHTPALAPGEQAKVSLEITAPATQRVTTSAIPADVKITAGDYSLRGSLDVNVTKGSTVPGENGDHGVRSCLDDQSDPAADAPVTLNMVTNCSFETNDFVSSARDWEFFGASKTSHLATETLSDGTENTYALIDTGAIDNHIWQSVPTQPGKTYVVSADVKVDADGAHTPSSVFLTAKGQKPDGTQNQAATTQLTTAELTDATTWTRKTFTFTAVNWNTLVGVIKWAAQDAEKNVTNTTIAMDNLTVYEQESYDLVWSDEFDGSALDQNSWGYELGNVRGNEQEHYSSDAENVNVSDGALHLTATDRPAADQYKNTARWGTNARTVKYNSGSVRTEGREEFLYGRVEARIKAPQGKGAFPAFWMLGADFPLDGRVNTEQGYGWPSTGETDIMEMIGAPTEQRAAEGETAKSGTSNSVAYGTPHFYYTGGDADGDGSYAPTALGGNLTTADKLADGYHVYGIDWTPDYLAWYVDGVVYNIMYFPTDATTAAGNQAFVSSEVARFQAAADSLNRPQYLQLNLATGGNWAGDASDHLGEDGTNMTVDWVRYYRSAAQTEAADAYYADQPTIDGAGNRVMVAGQAADLVDGVTTDDGYHVDYSIDNEPMFVNGGVEGGRNEVTLVVDDATDTDALTALAPGVYSLHYSALKDGATYSGAVTPDARVARKTVLLTVLPADGLHGAEGDALSTVALPDGWTWVDGDQVIGGADAYDVVFTQAADTVTAPADRRALTVSLPASAITPAQTGATLAIDATASTVCKGGKAYVEVRADNGNDAVVDYTFDTAYGTKAVENVKSGKSAYHAFSSRLVDIPAGAVTVSASADIDGTTVTAQKELSVDARTCG